MSLPKGPYDLIYADPAWRFKSNSEARPGRNAMRHYDCMDFDDIVALPVRGVVAKDALLLLWVTAPFAEMAFTVVREWGFRYKSQLVWCKDRIGTGYWARNRHELLYICRRGRFPCPRPAPFSDSVFSGEQREHSRKPEAIRSAIETAFPGTRKLEMFARHTRPGWDCWGNETTRFNEEDIFS